MVMATETRSRHLSPRLGLLIRIILITIAERLALAVLMSALR